MDFAGKVAVVTGGAQGIGKAVSMTFLNHGMKVLVCDVNDSSAKSFLEEVPDNLKPNVIYQKCDVSSRDEFKAAFERAKSTFGRIDIVMNNAGIQSERDWERMIQVNLNGVINGIHLAIEFMGKNNGGSGGFVINTSSIAGIYGAEFVPVYCATKHGVVGLTRSYGTQYHFDKTGIVMNAVCPGSIDTQMLHSYGRGCLDEKLGEEFVAQFSALSPYEIGKAVMQLLQDKKKWSAFICGVFCWYEICRRGS